MTTDIDVSLLIELMLSIDEDGPKYTEQQKSKLIRHLKEQWPTYPTDTVETWKFRKAIDEFERKEFPEWHQ